MIDDFKDNKDFNLDCVDPLNRSALISAIENENIDLIHILLEKGIHVKVQYQHHMCKTKQNLNVCFELKFSACMQLQDALLHAIKEEYVEAVEVLLEWEEQNHKPGERYVNINLQFTHAPRSNQKGRLQI